MFNLGGMILASTTAFAHEETVTSPGSSGSPTYTSNCPAPDPVTVERGLANVTRVDRGIYTASALGISGIAMKTGAFYIGFVCAAAVLIGIHMAGIPAKNP